MQQPTTPEGFRLLRIRLGRGLANYELYNGTTLVSNYATKELASKASWRILGASHRDTMQPPQFQFPAYLEGFNHA